MTTRPSTPLIWRKSSHSDDGNCVEVADTHKSILVRDSKNSAGPLLRFAPEQWRTFTQAVRDGGFPFPTAREQ
ncbi:MULTISPECIES: DUF397 domain-containing protein [unclassified Micromonospora]|uniref:DUF397 domain-containing protein n=1 Tax=unclassified Micromonospora TaxID=2617518 RepID=UPI001C2265E2|nr:MULTISPECIES: DUF397 domain-containing protein [unclassified Micromonospora]MBU8857689.1 DUF397 domain-containing protein [Micromonospora sp. WMMB482]MDM4783316.1 DUF397 domain-containing protein [Micromonospora sp. b486]